MTRHIFAFLALLSGLAALNAPAQASYVDAMACDTSVSASASGDVVSDRIADNAPPSTASESTAAEAPEYEAPRPASLRLPVLMGIERAYE